MKRTYGSWASPSLGRTMEYLWFGDQGRPLVLFPTSMGRFYQNEDFGLVGALSDKVDAGWLQIICVDSVDAESWYNNQAHPCDRARRHDDYDRYLRNEMFPLIVERTGGNIAVCGASFGAYHAANAAGRHAGLVTKAICFSGLYHMGRYLDGYWDETCYFHSPAAYIPNMDDGWCGRLRHVEWIVATGEHDSLIAENRGFADILRRKNIGVHAEFWPGVFGHDWPFWNDAVRRFI
ncbi:MAG TPA: alpha/beta hydrolase-fold protein [Thermoanaerobaculia bacterium]|nr:alpha/beta hydrolase-fold protein [Thermoanaerobaculia bacterium]